MDTPRKKIILSKLSKCFPRFSKLLWVCIILPTLLSVAYFGFMASDVYISESSFVVRSHNKQSATTGLGALLQSTGIARAQDDTYTVNAYIRSRDVIPVLDKKIKLSDYYGSEDIDLFSRFDPFAWDHSNEALYQYLNKKIVIDLDAVSAISTLKIKAYTPEVAFDLNESLLSAGEALINQLNERARKDMIGFSERQVVDAELRVKNSADALYTFRMEHGIFDLNKQGDAQIQLISKLQDALISVQTQLTQVQAVTPDNPQIPALKARERSLTKEIQTQTFKVFGTNNKALTTNAAEYERLILEKKLSEQQLIAAMGALETANEDAQRKQLYLERIAQPNKADAPLEPRRFMSILATFVVGLLIYMILKLFVVSVREHQS